MKGNNMTDKEFIEQLAEDGKILKAPADPVDEKSVFEVLNGVNVNGHTEGRGDLTYLSWTWAISEVMKRYPDMYYEVMKFDGLPYVFDEKTGYMVYTKVTIKGITHEMWLPVMDSSNKAMKNVSYTYKVKDKKTGEMYEKTVEAATMFDINKTIMRCLTKNLAMFGLGHYIYAGEDLPEVEKEENEAKVIKEMTDELKGLWDQAGLSDGFEDWLGKNTSKKPLTEMFADLKTSLKKRIADNAEKEKEGKK